MNNKKDDRKRRRMVLSLMIIMLIFTTASVGAIIICNNFKKEYQNNIESLYNIQFEYIEDLIYSLNDQAYNEIYPLADEIEIAIRNHYPNLDILKRQLAEENYTEISELIGSYIIGKYMNGIETEQNDIIVANNDGILCDYSYSDADFISNSNRFRTWRIFANKTGNPELAEKAVDSIINKLGGIIFYETSVYDQKDKHIHISSMSINDLKNIYLTEGLEALKNYEFMVPVYITEDGDIFGQKDIVQGMRYDNYKFIIIQTYSLYEQLVEFHEHILIDDNSIRELEENFSKNLLGMYLICFLICMGTVYYVFQISYLFNKYLDIDKLKQDIAQ